GDRHAVEVVVVVRVGLGRVLGQDLLVQLDAGVVGPLRVGRILQVDGADRAFGGVIAGRLHGRDRVRDRVVDDGRVPVQRLLRLQGADGEGGRGEHGEDVGAGLFQVRDLR